MTRLILAAGVAALAITAPAASQPGERAKDRKEQVQKKRGEARAQRAERREARQQRPRVERRAQRAERIERRAQRAERVERRAQGPERVERRAQRAERIERRAQRAEPLREQRAQRLERVRDDRLARQNRQIERIAERRGFQLDRQAVRDDRQLARLAQRDVIRLNDWNDLARGGIWVNGCPPGLAKKPVACVPPGQVNKFVGEPISALGDRIALQSLPNRLRFVYPDTDDFYYRYGNGYVYQVNRSNDLIMSLLPLFGLGLTVGQPFPQAYSNYYLPAGLQPFYAGGTCSPADYLYGGDYYRYANGYVYEIDCRTGLVEDVDPLLGYGYGYGQMMPLTYSAYNVPYQYRPLYYDTSDYYYRYAPGAIYQVDPTTSLITGVAALLTGGLTVGQPLPLGFSAYNVPYAYRTTYYDRPDAWYRYSNGYVYRVDPATMLVTAIVASALT